MNYKLYLFHLRSKCPLLQKGSGQELSAGCYSSHICFIEAGGTGHAGGLRLANRQCIVAFKEGGEPVLSCHLGGIPSIWIFAAVSAGQFVGKFAHLKHKK